MSKNLAKVSLESILTPKDFRHLSKKKRKLFQTLLHSEYGFNPHSIIELCRSKQININLTLKYQGIHCSLFHAAVDCYHLIKFDIPFRKFLIMHQPVLDLKDEYGRTALAVITWHLSSSMSLKDAKIVRTLVEYGFNPFIKFRGLRIVDKLKKIQSNHYKGEMKRKQNGSKSFSAKNHLNKSVMVISSVLMRITYYISTIEAIHAGLDKLVRANVLVYDMGKIITNYVGVCHYDDYVQQKQCKVQYRAVKNHGLPKDFIFIPA